LGILNKIRGTQAIEDAAFKLRAISKKNVTEMFQNIKNAIGRVPTVPTAGFRVHILQYQT
jgi:hypothetical protein